MRAVDNGSEKDCEGDELHLEDEASGEEDEREVVRTEPASLTPFLYLFPGIQIPDKRGTS